MDNNEEHFDEKELRRLVFSLQWIVMIHHDSFTKTLKKEDYSHLSKAEPPLYSVDGVAASGRSSVFTTGLPVRWR